MVEEAKQPASITNNRPWEYFVGGGVAAFDCNGDRMPDLVMPAGQPQQRSTSTAARPAANCSFEEKSNAVLADGLGQVTGLYPLDIDNDGHTRPRRAAGRRERHPQGRAGLHVQKANRLFSFNGGRAWTTAFAATFEAGPALPDAGFRQLCRPLRARFALGHLPRQRVDPPAAPTTRDRDYAEPAERFRRAICALSMMFTDWNHSGEPALRIANDRQYYRGGEEQLWRVDARQAAAALPHR